MSGEPAARARRVALYFVPGDDSSLARFGNAVLGRDAAGAAVAPEPPLPPTPPEWVERPARYGFHATLKAPFRLAADADEEALVARCEALARAHRPIALPSLAPRAFDGFTALALDAPDDALDALAADAVVSLDGLRAPLAPDELARRRPERLDAAARERLERWGYPHVLEGFRFHMTLSGALAPSPPVDAWREGLARACERLVGSSATLDRVALCREVRPGGRFVRVREFPL